MGKPKNDFVKDVQYFYPNPDEGLTSYQVNILKEAGHVNDCSNFSYKTTSEIIKDNVFTFFNLIFTILAVCLILVGSFKDMLFFLIVIINTLIGIIQQLRSKRALDKMTIMSMPKTEVIRDKKQKSVKTNELVREDIVIFKAGNQITADCKILNGEIEVDESLLTGESDPVIKRSGDELLSGSFIITGKCKAILTRVGIDSYSQQLTLEAKKEGKMSKSEMMNSLDKLIKIIGFTLIPIGICLFLKQQIVLNLTIQKAVVSTVAALVGMIPEGLYLLTSVALAVSVMKLSRNKTLVHDMNCIETLARVDVLCVDKTGTITEPKMKVYDTVLLNDIYKKEDIEDLIGSILNKIEPENDTANALKERFKSDKDIKIIKRYPFSSATKFEGIVLDNNKTYLYGSPENILKNNYYKIENIANKYAKQGYRVLLFSKLQGKIEEKNLIGDVEPICLILLKNPIREDARETFEFFKQQGVNIKVISGDNPIMVSNIAKEAGIDGYDKYIDALKINENNIDYLIDNYTVFGRVTPNQKRQLINALKENGHCVAMTGDGVNDILALRDANVGIAMASGSDAAGQAADLVLLNSNFSSMPKIVDEGRRVINNIERAAALFLVKNIFSFLLSLISLVANIPYPFTPLQLSLVSAVTIGIPSFFLALESNHSIVSGKFMVNVFSKALPGGLTDLALLLGAQLLAYAYNLTNSELSTISTILLGIIGLIILYDVSKPFKIQRAILFNLMTASLLISFLFFGKFFSLETLTFQGTISLITLLLLSYPSYKTIKYILIGIYNIFGLIKNKVQRLKGRNK